MKKIIAALALSMLPLAAAVSPAAAAVTCTGTYTISSHSKAIKIGITDEGEPTYVKAGQYLKVKSCSDGSDVLLRAIISYTAPCGRPVKALVMNPYSWGGVDKGPTRIVCAQGVNQMEWYVGKRYPRGAGDRCAGAKGYIDRALWYSNVPISIPEKCVI